jgi:hypothetical protein
LTCENVSIDHHPIRQEGRSYCVPNIYCLLPALRIEVALSFTVVQVESIWISAARRERVAHEKHVPKRSSCIFGEGAGLARI